MAETITFYEGLSAEKKQNPLYLATVVATCAKLDTATAEKYAAKLPPLIGTEKLDIQALEAKSAPRAPLKR